MKNVEFLRRHARAGRVGLLGGTAPSDRAVRFGQRPLVPGGKDSLWSHVVVFEGTRFDGAAWLIESDLGLGGGQFRNGVQENRIDKYADAGLYPNLAVLDFGLGARATRRLLAAALDFVSRRTTYSVTGVLKTYWAILRNQLGEEKEKDSKFCSSFVRAVFKHVGVDLFPGVAVRHTTPEHIGRTPVPHRRVELIRDRG